MLLRKIVAAVAMALSVPALAQSPQFGAGQVFGNSTAAQRPGRPETVTAILDRALGSTRGAILERAASGWAVVGPGATVGLPWISGGTGADPAYGILAIVGGGTGSNTAAGARTNLGVTATGADTTYNFRANNLSDVANASTSRTNLGLAIGTNVQAWDTDLDCLATLATTGIVHRTGTGTCTAVAVALGTGDVSGQLGYANGGCNAASQAGCTNNLFPTPTRAGDVAYWNGSAWTSLAGNNSGTNVLTENASGVPSWAAPGAGTVSSVGIAAGTGISVSGTCTITTSGTCTIANTGVTSVAGGYGVTGGPITTTGTLAVSLSLLTNSLGADVLLNNTANYFDGPSVAQGTTGTWWADGTVTVLDTANSANIYCKLWDGTTVIASSQMYAVNVLGAYSISLHGYLASPAGNIRISCRDITLTTGKIVFNNTGNSKDSTISVHRVQ